MEQNNRLMAIEDWSSGVLNGDDSADVIVCASGTPDFRLVEDECVLVNPKAVDVEKLLDGGQLRHIISDESVDRHGDIVRVKGWDLTHYKKNPVILLAHSHSNLPIGKSIRIIKRLKEKQLVSIGEYPSAQLYQHANDVFRLAACGYINASSVGFMPKEWEPIDEEQPWLGYDITKQELWEYSIVPVPANPNALINAANALPGGVAFVKRWAEETLDCFNRATPNKELEESYENVTGNRTTVCIEGVKEYVIDRAVEYENLNEAIEDLKAELDELDNCDTLSDREGDMFIETRDHDEDTFIKKETKTDPVVINIIPDPIIEVDESVIKNMVADLVTKMTGRLIDREESNGND